MGNGFERTLQTFDYILSNLRRLDEGRVLRVAFDSVAQRSVFNKPHQP